MAHLTKSISLFIAFLLIFSCKKYEENPFLKPGWRGTFPENCNITSYTIDGVDCVAYINSRLQADIRKIKWEFIPNDQNGLIADIRSDYFWGQCELNKKKTEFTICGETLLPGTTNKFDLFAAKCGSWTVTKRYFHKKRYRFKIEKDFNGKKYQIQFD